MVKEVASVSAEQETMIHSMVEKTMNFSDPVFSLVGRRIQSNIRHQLEKGYIKKESLGSHGLDVISKELEKISKAIHSFAKHNKSVYVNYYDEILTALIQ